MTDLPGTPLGDFLETARRERARISGREAARRAGMSEGRWRQIVRGGTAPARTIVAMALAVDIDPAAALHDAGMPTKPEAVDALISDVRRRAAQDAEPAAPVASGLAGEIERIKVLPLPADEKIRIATALIELYEEKARTPAE